VQSERFLCCWQTSKWCQKKSDCFVIDAFISLEQAIFPSGRKLHEKRHVIHLDNCSVHASRPSRDQLEKHRMRRMHRMLHSSYSPDLTRVTSICFRQWEKNSNGFRWPTRTSFSTACKRFRAVFTKTNWMDYFMLVWGRFIIICQLR
jgi:hypothetical protein